MTAGAMVQSWAITIVFLLVAGYAALRGLRTRGVRRVSQLLHLVMAVAMIAMAWLSQPDWLGWLQLVVFLAAGVWYLLPSTRCRCDRASTAAHVAMHFGMAWMALVMIIRPPGTAASLAGIAVLVGLLATGSQQVVALGLTARSRVGAAGSAATVPGVRTDRVAVLVMLAGMIIMTLPMIAVAEA